MNDLTKDLMQAHESPDVEKGTCVVAKDGVVVYVGPIGSMNCPPVEGTEVYLHPEDFNSLSKFVKKTSH